jgi:hypothetical protein
LIAEDKYIHFGAGRESRDPLGALSQAFSHGHASGLVRMVLLLQLNLNLIPYRVDLSALPRCAMNQIAKHKTLEYRDQRYRQDKKNACDHRRDMMAIWITCSARILESLWLEPDPVVTVTFQCDWQILILDSRFIIFFK